MYYAYIVSVLTFIPQIQLSKHVAVNSATAHPHIDDDGTLYNLGSSANGYTIIKIPPTGKGDVCMEQITE